jgi:hypothetical protein
MFADGKAEYGKIRESERVGNKNYKKKEMCSRRVWRFIAWEIKGKIRLDIKKKQ